MIRHDSEGVTITSTAKRNPLSLFNLGAKKKIKVDISGPETTVNDEYARSAKVKGKSIIFKTAALKWGVEKESLKTVKVRYNSAKEAQQELANLKQVCPKLITPGNPKP